MKKKLFIFVIFLIQIYTIFYSSKNSLKNIQYSINSYIASNITIRQSFFFENNRLKKGTHEPAEKQFIPYFKKVLSDIGHILTFDEILLYYKQFQSYDYSINNFLTEISIIENLYKISKIKFNDKTKFLIYIPKSFTEYWDMSCDDHMTPFIAPAITGIPHIEGLPITDDNKLSCYGGLHLLSYGYQTYYSNGRKSSKNDFSTTTICSNALTLGFDNLIIIKRNSDNYAETSFINCNLYK